MTIGVTKAQENGFSMYKFLLCWRYLLTKYIALASVISVTLGVATMIVVNSVMDGFTTEMQDRIHGVLSDVVFESRSMDGFPDPEKHMAVIEQVAGEYIEGMTPTVVVPAALCIDSYTTDASYTQPVQLVGIDIETQGSVSDFLQFLQHPGNRGKPYTDPDTGETVTSKPSFLLRDGGYDTRSSLLGEDALARPGMERAGWEHRCFVADLKDYIRAADRQRRESKRLMTAPLGTDPLGIPPLGIPPLGMAPAPTDPTTGGEESIYPSVDMTAPGIPPSASPSSIFDSEGGQAPQVQPDWMSYGEEPSTFDPRTMQDTGAILGIGLVSQRVKVHDPDTGEEYHEERFSIFPGDDVTICIPTVGSAPDYRPSFEDDTFTVTDFYECRMAEYDSQLVFVPIERLQQLRGMVDPNGRRYVTQILIDVKDGTDLNMVRDKIREAFNADIYVVSTWRDKQGILLQAVQTEIAILNVLLFLIIAVAGFGILAIFFMIVVEKTRDIGILKSLGASGAGIMQIFLAYGLALGTLGSGTGLVLGLLFVHYINEIAGVLSLVLGHEVFDPSIYYFYQIPTIVNPWTIFWIMFGAIGIAVIASLFPALRAARMHPVEALRHE